MKDDELLPRPASGLEVLGEHRPRIDARVDSNTGKRLGSFDTYTGERLDPVDPTPEEAEARSLQHRRERAESVFADPVWPAEQVISWIGYRDVQVIEKPFRAALYRDSHPVVESRPRIALLLALQTDGLRAIRRRGQVVDKMGPEEWAFVERQWPTDQWPDCRFTRSDIVALWPPIPAPGSEIEPAAVETPIPAVEVALVAMEASSPQVEAAPAVVEPVPVESAIVESATQEVKETSGKKDRGVRKPNLRLRVENVLRIIYGDSEPELTSDTLMLNKVVEYIDDKHIKVSLSTINRARKSVWPKY